MACTVDLMLREGLFATAIKAAIVSAIGALVTILVERAWTRHKAKKRARTEEQG